jgi:plasmid stabilization system protein ParE
MAKIIRWTKDADESYLEMINFIKLIWNDEVVKKFVRATFSVLETISRNPEMYAAKGAKNVRRAIIRPNVSLIYKINKEHIDILLFIDNRSKPIKRKF